MDICVVDGMEISCSTCLVKPFAHEWLINLLFCLAFCSMIDRPSQVAISKLHDSSSQLWSSRVINKVGFGPRELMKHDASKFCCLQNVLFSYELDVTELSCMMLLAIRLDWIGLDLFSSSTSLLQTWPLVPNVTAILLPSQKLECNLWHAPVLYPISSKATCSEDWLLINH